MHSVMSLAKLSFRSAVKRSYSQFMRRETSSLSLTSVLIGKLTETILDKEEELHNEFERERRGWII